MLKIFNNVKTFAIMLSGYATRATVINKIQKSFVFSKHSIIFAPINQKS